MSDGTLSIRRRQAKASENAANDLFSLPALKSGAYESFLGNLPSIGLGHVKSKQKSKPVGDVDEFRVESKRKKRLKEYDRLLKSFQYSAALDSVLHKVRHWPLFFEPVELTNTAFVASTANDNIRVDARADPPGWLAHGASRTGRCSTRAYSPPPAQTRRRPTFRRNGMRCLQRSDR